MVCVAGIETIKKEQVPGKESTMKDELFKHFETLAPKNALKIDTKLFNCKLSGLRYVIYAWNISHPDEPLAYHVEHARHDPIVYIMKMEVKKNEN